MSAGEKPRFQRPRDDSLYKPTTFSTSATVIPTTDQQKNVDVDSHTSFVYNRFNSLPVEQQRARLPIFNYKNHLLYLLERYQTVILVGETGSGKSTQIPQYLHENGYENTVVTQPRVVSAISLASRVTFEQEATTGNSGHVAHAVSFHATNTKNTRIKFVTEGILLREMFSDPLLTQYSCLMLDEVHERSQLTDLIMGLVKKILKKRKNLKLIVSSATMDAEFLRDFFNLNARNKSSDSKRSYTSAILSVEGRIHPVDVFYIKEPVPDYVQSVVDTVIKIHENKPFGDVLAFVTGQDEVLAVVRLLTEYARENNETNKKRSHFESKMAAADMSVLPMYGSLPSHEQLKVFQMAGSKVRKVVIATNIAETSITIPGITYVIDCGYHKIRYFDASTNHDTIIICPISKANAEQRAGRAGRINRGQCYRLYTEEYYQKMSNSVPPEMQRSELSSVVLQLKALGIDNVLRFSFPSPPPARLLLNSVEVLYALKALDQRGQLTEDTGRLMAELPIRPMLAKILTVSGEFGCLEEALSIVSMLQIESPFIRPGGGQAAINAKIAKRNNFEVAEGDLVTLLNVYDSYSRFKKSDEFTRSSERHQERLSKEWCRKYFINEKAMRKVTEIRRNLDKLVKQKFGLRDDNLAIVEFGSAKMERLLRCLASGLFPNACYLHHCGSYRGISSERNSELHISPDSCLYYAQQPQWVIYGSVQSSVDKTYIRELTVIQSEWLTELAPHYYKES